MKIVIFQIVVFSLFVHCVDAQKNNRMSRRDVQRMKEKGLAEEQKNLPFAPPIKQNENRDDFIWNAETARTAKDNTGNLSFTTPTRIGMQRNFEFSTVLGFDAFVPNIFIKRQFLETPQWVASTRHGLFSPSLGYEFFPQVFHDDAIYDTMIVPIIFDLRNELLVSRIIKNKRSCTSTAPFAIVTGSAGFDLGFNPADVPMAHPTQKFLGNRLMATQTLDYQWFLRLRGDIMVHPMFYSGLGMAFFSGSFPGTRAYELTARAEFVPAPFLGLTVSLAGAYDQYSGSPRFSWMPLIDLSFYFGKKRVREKGLFG